MQNLIKIFEGLAQPESSKDIQIFNAVQLTGTSHRIGKDASGWPVLLLENSSREIDAPVRLEHLEIQHSLRCRVSSDDSTQEGTYTVIRCTEADGELARYFLNIIEPVLKLLGPAPTFKQVSDAINHLVELFRALSQPPIKSVSGLWGELFLIQNSKNPEVLLEAWHASPEEKYDFSLGTQRIEVKSTSRGERLHHFSLEQLIPPAECKVVVASIFVERNGGGTSLGEMTEKIRQNIKNRPDLQERLDQILASTLGNTLRLSFTSRFDNELAKESLQFFDSTDIPRITPPLPDGIQDVHFKSSLSQCQPLKLGDLIKEGGIFGVLG